MKSHQRKGLHSNGSCSVSIPTNNSSNKSHRSKNHHELQMLNGDTNSNKNSVRRAKVIGRIATILVFFALLAFPMFHEWRLLMAASSSSSSSSSSSRASSLESHDYVSNLIVSNHSNHGGGDAVAGILDATPRPLEASYPHRHCESPEYNTPFPYRHVETFVSKFAAFQSNSNINTGLVGKSKSSDTTCEVGQQNELTRFLLHVSKEIQILRGDQCKYFTRYSASFGSHRKSRKFITKMQFPTISDCTFLFMVDDETRNLRPLVGSEGITRSNSSVLFQSTRDPTAIRIPIPRDILPFTSMRRNTRLIKMHGPILFPWVQRLLWMDAKLNRAGPVNYFVNYFRRTVQEPNVCASFVSAPIHPSVLGSSIPLNATMPSFQIHCNTIIRTATERPNLTDSADIILRQCDYYARRQEARSRNPKINNRSSIRKNMESERDSLRHSGLEAEQPMIVPHPQFSWWTWQHALGMSSAVAAAAASALSFASDKTIVQTDLTLDAAMIDGAMIAWDLRSARCRQFNADFGCTWGDEIHCNADRDQLSFPYSVQQMGLTWDRNYTHHWSNGQHRMTTSTSIMARQSQKTAQQQLLQEMGKALDERPVAITDTKHQHTRLLEQESGLPAILMVKSECHWYDTPVIDCVLQEQFEIESATGSTISHSRGGKQASSDRDRSNHDGDNNNDDDAHHHHEARRGGHESQPQHGSVKRVAIVMAGPLQRFMIETTLQHLLLPLVQQQGHQVDVYISLSTDEKTRHETPSSEWVGKLAYLANLVPEPLLEHVIDEEFRFDLVVLRSVLQLSVEHQGATLKHLYITDGIDLDTDPLVVARHKEALNQYPDEHPDWRFPVLNLHGRDMKTHNRDRLRFYKSVQLLWENVVDVEKQGRFFYDQIVFLPVDSYWFADFHLDRLLASEEADLFVQSCAVGQLPLMEVEIESYPVVASRESAELLGNYYSYLFEMNLNACAQNLSEKKGTNITTTGCTTGMIFDWALKRTGFTVSAAGRGVFPLERALNVRSTERETCLLTFCPRSERRDATVTLHAMPQCKHMAWPPPPKKGAPPRPEKVSLPYGGCKGNNTQLLGEAKIGTLTCGLCQQNKFTEFLSFVSEKIRVLKEVECKSMIQYSVKLFNSYESEWEIATQHSDDAVGSCVFSFVLRDEMKYTEPYQPDTADFLFEHTTDKTALLIPVPRRVLPYRNMNRNVKLIQLYGHQIFTWVDRLIYMGSHLRRGVDSSTFHRYFQNTVELNRVCIAFAAMPLRDDRGDISDAFFQVGMNPEDVTNQRQSLDKIYDRVLDAGLIAWDLWSDRCRKFNADLACTWGVDIRRNLTSDQFGYVYSFWQMGLIEANKNIVDSTTTSTSVWRSSTNNKPAVSIVDSRCHWYASATLECESAHPLETIELSFNASCPSGGSCDGLTKSGEGSLNFAAHGAMKASLH